MSAKEAWRVVSVPDLNPLKSISEGRGKGSVHNIHIFIFFTLTSAHHFVRFGYVSSTKKRKKTIAFKNIL